MEIIEYIRLIGSELMKVMPLQHISIGEYFPWHFEQSLLFRPFLQTFICVDLVDLNILTRRTLAEHACFISLQMTNKI